MIAIVDGGSTKCDWVILDISGEQKCLTKTKGFNPTMIPAELIPVEINNNKDLQKYKDSLEYLFFYGSGCGIQENKDIVRKQLQTVFPKAVISVEEDILAAAYSVYRGNKTMVCILGTGSNSCYFDGEKVHVELPSLGFLLGDDGAGSTMGKSIVKNYFMKKLPPVLENEFKKDYNLSIEELLENIYHKNNMVNAYFATFSKFIAKWREHPFIQNLVFENLQAYVEFQLLPYKEIKNVEVSFIGSIAHIYSDILKTVLAHYNLKLGVIVQKPIENLVKYHIDYIFPTLKK